MKDVNGHRKCQGFGRRKCQGPSAAPRREQSDRSGAAGREHGGWSCRWICRALSRAQWPSRQGWMDQERPPEAGLIVRHCVRRLTSSRAAPAAKRGGAPPTFSPIVRYHLPLSEQGRAGHSRAASFVSSPLKRHSADRIPWRCGGHHPDCRRAPYQAPLSHCNPSGCRRGQSVILNGSHARSTAAPSRRRSWDTKNAPDPGNTESSWGQAARRKSMAE